MENLTVRRFNLQFSLNFHIKLDKTCEIFEKLKLHLCCKGYKTMLIIIFSNFFDFFVAEISAIF